MADPMIRNVLNNFQENPKQAQEDMKDPSVVRGARLHDQRRTLAFRTPCNRARSLPSRGVAQRAVHCSSSLSLSGVCMVRWGAGREAEQAHCGGCAQDWLSLPRNTASGVPTKFVRAREISPPFAPIPLACCEGEREQPPVYPPAESAVHRKPPPGTPSRQVKPCQPRALAVSRAVLPYLGTPISHDPSSTTRCNNPMI
jgi:hypothetical protein